MMGRTAIRLAAFLLAVPLSLTLCVPAFAAGEDNPPANLVYDQQELFDWCNSNTEGGTVTLGQDVVLDTTLAAYDSFGHIIIDTGPNSLILDGGTISLHSYEVIGEGVGDKPVVDVKYAAMFRGNWNHALQRLVVTARGRDGTGGTAVRVRDVDDGWAVNMDFFMQEGRICSYGKGAVGLLFNIPVDAWCFNVAVEGANSTAVIMPDGGAMRYSKLSASGAGAQTVCGNILLDTCRTNPEPQSATVVTRSAALVAERQYYLAVPQYETPDMMFINAQMACSGADDDPENVHELPIRWPGELVDGVDTSELGFTTVPGHLDPPFHGLGLENPSLMELTVEVRDPALPCLVQVVYNDYLALYSIMYWRSQTLPEAPLILWRSDDEGETWYDYTDNASVGLYPDSDHFTFSPAEDETYPIMFVLETPGAGPSNVLTLHPDRVWSMWGGGGDRTGTDRDGGDRPGGGDGRGSGGDDIPGTPPSDGGNQPDDDDNDDDTGDDTNNDDNDDGDRRDDTPGTPPSGGGDDRPNRTSVNPATIRDEPEAALVPAAIPEAAPQPSPPQEYETDTAVALSGKRLAVLIEENPAGVAFVKQGVRVVVESQALAALGLSDHQLFTVTIERNSGGADVRFTVDGQDTLLPYTLEILGEVKEEPAAITIDMPVIQAPVHPDKPGSVAPAAPSPLWLAPLSLAVLGGGLFLRLRRKEVRK